MKSPGYSSAGERLSGKSTGWCQIRISVFNACLTLSFLCFCYACLRIFAEEKSSESRPQHVYNHRIRGSMLVKGRKHNTRSPSTEKMQHVKFKPKAESLNDSFTVENEMACHLPKLKPFDPSVLPYFEKPLPMQCYNETHPILFQSDFDRTLIQVKDPVKYGYRNCCYTPFRRVMGSETEAQYFARCLPIKHKKTVLSPFIEFIKVSCVKNNETMAVDFFGFIPRKRKNQKFNNSGSKVNVVILGLDSMSHMNLQRTMPLTFEYLTQNLNAIGMDGYTKVGYNTFPNVVPALTGHSVTELQKMGWKSFDHYFDPFPFIWKNYAARGYTTAYGEDAVDCGIFNYQKLGFYSSPTDHYYHTLTAQMDQILGHRGENSNNNLCYGPRLAFDILLEFIQKMAVAMSKSRQNNGRGQPYFQFLWATSLFHDDLNNGFHGDEMLLKILKWMKIQGYLDNTMFILMSDHGSRFSDITETLQGKIEDRMPFLYFVVPPRILNSPKYSEAMKNLRKNRHKLTTPFDLHETLMQLLDLDSLSNEKILKGKNNGKHPRGISLFSLVSPRRICEDAEIREIFCVCRFFESIQVTNHSDLLFAGRKVVHEINGMLLRFPQCKTLELDKIDSARMFETIENKRTQEENVDNLETSTELTEEEEDINDDYTFKKLRGQGSVTYSMSLFTKPGGARFEAAVSRTTADEKWNLLGEIIRTNLYGNQSWCVDDYVVKNFCFCN